MLPALLLAAACAGWQADATGFYRGEVESQGIKPIDTWLERTDHGLAGHYVLHEPTRDVNGTLEPLGEAGCDVGLFRWTDIYGTGIARLHFHLEAHCFEGSWGLDEPRPALIWRSCRPSNVTS